MDDFFFDENMDDFLHWQKDRIKGKAGKSKLFSFFHYLMEASVSEKNKLLLSTKRISLIFSTTF